MNYRLLALDLDGTTIGPGLDIDPAVSRAIEAAQARGVRVTLATGRTFGATRPFARRLHIHDPLICYQGAMVCDPLTAEIYEHEVTPGHLAAEAVDLLRDRDIFVFAYIDERLCVAERRPELDMYLTWHPEGVDLVVEPDLAGLVAAQPPTKLLFVADPPVVELETARLAEHFAGSLSVVRSHALFGELTALGISKGAALERLAARLEIPREQVVAIGDHENDLPMIAWAGLGLAIGNAIPSVRALADAILPPVEQAGVAWAIERYILSGG
ncbi:MAG: HAD family phosphatase [Kouleothrix sp.]|nr:HAD family phosphatase [Kouleothrix sp.]